MRQVEEGHQVWQPWGLPVLRALPGLEQELGRVGRRDQDPQGQLGEFRQEGEAIRAASGEHSLRHKSSIFRQSDSPVSGFSMMEQVIYRVAHLLANLGWVDFDLECSTILLGQ